MGGERERGMGEGTWEGIGNVGGEREHERGEGM